MKSNKKFLADVGSAPTAEECQRQMLQIRPLDAPLLKRQIELEHANERLPEDFSIDPLKLKERADCLRNGQIPSPVEIASWRLPTVVFTRAAVKLALEDADREWQIAENVNSQRRRDQRAPDLRENARAILLGVFEVQKQNRRRIALFKEIRGKAPTLALPFEINTETLLGNGRPGTPIHAIMVWAVREGIITPKEIARARGDSEKELRNAFGV